MLAKKKKITQLPCMHRCPSFFFPIDYNFLSMRKLFLQFADGKGILHDSEGSCEKPALSFCIYHLKMFR